MKIEARKPVVALLGTCALAVLTAAAAPSWPTFRTDSTSIRHPPAWFATTRQLTPVDWPPQVLAVASYAFPDATAPNGCEPAGTLARMPPSGALIYVIEYTYTPSKGFPTGLIRTKDFPPRPAHFRLGSARRYECFGPRRSYLLRFRERKRLFQVSVALGRTTGSRARTTVLRILDSFEARAR